MMKKTWFLCGLMLLLININAEAKDLKAGPWKFLLRTTNAEIPFIIDFEYDKQKVLTGLLHNGGETIKLKDITQKDGEIVIPVANYEVTLEMSAQEDNTLSGSLVRNNKNPKVKQPVMAIHGVSERFKFKKEKPFIDLTGKWTFVMEDEEGKKSPGIGNFKQDGNHLSGSILTPTGDYRYLDGYVNDDSFEAASFDGVYNYLFKGKVREGKMEAAILSNSKTKITGQKDAKAKLPDAYKQTEINELKFIFPDLKGQAVSLSHKKFKNKPVIVQIYGSWCPNCLDEMNFLIPWYNKNNKRGVEIIALAFERSLSPEEATRQLLKVQKKMKVPYTILQAGSTAEDKPMDKIIGLTNFISFPTTIFLDKKHKVVKVHAGFSGPSTGEFFETWKKEFNQTVNGLLKK
jgi:thiol-disulfide isomerase/thioredoxin